MKFWALIFGIITTAAMANTRPSIMVLDIDNDKVIMSQDSNATRSIASITKVMTAMVTLAWDSDLDRRIVVKASSRLGAGRHSRRDVITSLLVRSDNEAADALARDFPGGEPAFVKAMNRRAQLMGLYHARFVDASGLLAGNIATAGEVVQIMTTSLGYPIIRETSVLKQAMFEQNRGQVIRTIVLENTNRPLLYEFDDIIVSKTGFTRSAGWCVGLVVQRGRQRVAIVVLGAETKQQRYQLARQLVYNNLRDSEIDQKVLAGDPDRPSWWTQLKSWFTR